ncbi:dTDP-4-dehydrorhamnose 3,5-epimerase family protein [Streptomyces sp. NPDC002602]|uniref:dTDP-4-dehydrorhamnose 3,5-epimerase family protein n=1 Tax=Streptomyces sp. NPDC002602 TaxID=3364654 RepID=UPI0036AAE027
MKITELMVPGALRVVPRQHTDARGAFLEWYRPDLLAGVLGHRIPPMVQGNLSMSARGVVRGIHFAEVPRGQAKYVTCMQGAVLDVVVDLRVGSPAFGRWEAIELDDVERAAVYLPAGLGHGFCALTETATVSYLVSNPYAPEREHSVDAFDPELGIEWPIEEALQSERDRAAPSLAGLLDRGLLPRYEDCLELIR